MRAFYYELRINRENNEICVTEFDGKTKNIGFFYAIQDDISKETQSFDRGRFLGHINDLSQFTPHNTDIFEEHRKDDYDGKFYDTYACGFLYDDNDDKCLKTTYWQWQLRKKIKEQSCQIFLRKIDALHKMIEKVKAIEEYKGGRYEQTKNY